MPCVVTAANPLHRRTQSALRKSARRLICRSTASWSFSAMASIKGSSQFIAASRRALGVSLWTTYTHGAERLRHEACGAGHPHTLRTSAHSLAARYWRRRGLCFFIRFVTRTGTSGRNSFRRVCDTTYLAKPGVSIACLRAGGGTVHRTHPRHLSARYVTATKLSADATSSSLCSFRTASSDGGTSCGGHRIAGHIGQPVHAN